jgi:hypothetical protein
METFLAALLGHQVRFQFPRLWFTKGETLAKFISECDGVEAWQNTWSCWQNARQVSVNKKKRQCGICAACMLRRMSIHAAGLTESKQTYVWENLSARKFDDGAAPSFPREKITGKLRQYAIAGSLHLDHLAGVPSSASNAHALSLTVSQLSRSLNINDAKLRPRLHRMLIKHGQEWKTFMESLGRNSFIADWVPASL